MVFKHIYTNIKSIPLYTANYSIYCGENIITTEYFAFINCNSEWPRFYFTLDRALSINFKLGCYPIHQITTSLSRIYKYIFRDEEILEPTPSPFKTPEKCVIEILRMLDATSLLSGGILGGSCEDQTAQVIKIYEYEYEQPEIDEYGIVTLSKIKNAVFLEKSLPFSKKYLVKLNISSGLEKGSIVAEQIKFQPD